ncbi:MAG TPA: zf-HC2 domain-containing protein [bacterium]|nr:zf-HC2 domain-containing protein [bacterium]
MKNEKPCEMNPLFIEQFADSELSYAESAEMSEHLKTCAACRHLFDEVRGMKKALRAVNTTEHLTAIERAGLEKLIADTGERRPFLPPFLSFFFSGARLAVTGATLGIAALVTVLFYQIFTIERSADLLISEILHIHDSVLPGEIAAGDDLDKVVEKNLNITAPKLRKFVANKPVTKARFANLGAHPAASVHMANADGNGTLMVTHKNDDMKKLFTAADCVHEVKDCRAHKRTMNGKDLLFWEENEGNYLFVSDNRPMTSGMVQLISAE